MGKEGLKIAVIGAGGFIGNLLVEALSRNEQNSILAISLNKEHITLDRPNVVSRSCDVFDASKLGKLLAGYETAYYLIHMMRTGDKAFDLLEEKAARSFCNASSSAGVEDIVYLGGLGDSSHRLSKHLASRQKTGEILRGSFKNVIEFRASIVIGKGSAAVETIKQVVSKLSFLVLSRWANTPTQPINSDDVINYLIEAANPERKGHKIYEIGGPKVITYKDLVLDHADRIGKNIHVFTISFFPLAVEEFFLGLMLEERSRNTVLAMLESLHYPMVVTNDDALKDFPNIKPRPIEI